MLVLTYTKTDNPHYTQWNDLKKEKLTIIRTLSHIQIIQK